MENTETKYEFIFGEYTAHTYFGEYGEHTDWFKGEVFIATDLVPAEIQDQLNDEIEKVA